MSSKSKKKLTRNQDNAIVAGVMSGLAEYFDQDPVLFRLAGVVVLVLTGIFPGILLYLGAWIVMPPKSTMVDYEVVE